MHNTTTPIRAVVLARVHIEFHFRLAWPRQFDLLFLPRCPSPQLGFTPSYGLPIAPACALSFCRQIRTRTRQAPYPIAIAAVFWIRRAYLDRVLPPGAQPGPGQLAQTLNYAPVAVGIVLHYSHGFWAVTGSARAWFMGPITGYQADRRCANENRLMSDDARRQDRESVGNFRPLSRRSEVRLGGGPVDPIRLLACAWGGACGCCTSTIGNFGWVDKFILARSE